MPTIDQVLANPSEAAKAGRVWATIPLQGGKLVLTDNGGLIQADNADRGDGTFGPEVWPFKAGF